MFGFGRHGQRVDDLIKYIEKNIKLRVKGEDKNRFANEVKYNEYHKIEDNTENLNEITLMIDSFNKKYENMPSGHTIKLSCNPNYKYTKENNPTIKMKTEGMTSMYFDLIINDEFLFDRKLIVKVYGYRTE
ncbi:hypothetical protein [Mycoplasma elephantis]|uniref:hypothetical protein n=1 Tax=Mycoplasma elephantis TaxID=114882 RepID=UPI0004898D7B|nr:hypothetical protein [Mycoplasma elephantis]